jgi:hypothetical protein
VCNSYESYIYDIREKLSFIPVYQKVVNATVRDEILKILDEHRQWIGGEYDVPLNNSLNQVFRTINNTWPVAKPWRTVDQVFSAWNQYNRTRTWFDDKYALQLNRSDYEDPVVSVAEINTQNLLLEWNFNSTDRIMNPIPNPEPTPKLNETNINATDGQATDDVDVNEVDAAVSDTGGDEQVTDQRGGVQTSQETDNPASDL